MSPVLLIISVARAGHALVFRIFHTDVLFEEEAAWSVVMCQLWDRFEGTLSDVLEVGASIPVETNRLAKGRKSWRQDQLPSGQPCAGCLEFLKWSTSWQLVQWAWTMSSDSYRAKSEVVTLEVRDIPAGKGVGQRQPMTELCVVSGTYPFNPCRFSSLKHSRQ